MNYVPYYRKKIDLCREKEEALRRLIARDAAHDKLLRQAAEVRDARVRVLRARRATLVPWEKCQGEYDKLSAQMAEARQVTPESVLAEFGVETSIE
ncbi:MAG: hypothetical protein QM775_23835 [Pirellulales bacterium]